MHTRAARSRKNDEPVQSRYRAKTIAIAAK
jgi:hypothetical protein